MTQDQALAVLKTGANVFLTGEPGSGKTHTINTYVGYLRAHGIEPAVTASTGIAATHIGGRTIHSWSGIGIKAVLSKQDHERISNNSRLVDQMRKTQVLILDEISMLEARTLSAVDEACRIGRDDERPFGGMQVVLVGDFFQLPPVARKGEKVDFAFDSPAWEAARPVTCYLTEQHRQDDPEFLDVLSAIRRDCVTEEHAQILDNRLAMKHTIPSGLVKLFPHNMDVDRINDKQLSLIEDDERTFKMSSTGPEALVEALKRGCLSPEELRLRRGASVMFTRNNPQEGFVNGTLGKVTGWEAETGNPLVKIRDGGTIEVEPMSWSVEEHGRVRAQISQVPLRLAWAMTVHKSQGMSLDAALMDLGGAFEYGQGYVALSRVRRLSGLYLVGCNARALKVHPEILTKDREFRTESDETAVLEDGRSPEDRTEAERGFIMKCGGEWEEAAPAKTHSLTELRKKLPKAYARWTEDEEAQLTALFKEDTSIKEIAKRLERKPGGITARLKKLGLIDA